jgi:hypothetical protein
MVLERTQAIAADRETERDPAAREFTFLLACVRSFFEPGTPLPSAAGLHWPHLIALAERHAVVGLFWRAVQHRNDITASALAEIKEHVHRTAIFDLTLGAELSAILGLFSAEGIPVIALKGPVLAASLYGDAALRSSSDLDLLIQPQDVLRAQASLESRRYRLESTLPWTGDRACFRRRDSQMSFSRSNARTEKNDGPEVLWVDLHWRLLPGYFPETFDDREIWSHMRQAPNFRTRAATLPPETLLLFLCAHGTKHLWLRLSWICDIARLLQVEKEMDWTLVFAQTKQSDTQRMVTLGLSLASELLGVPVPAAAQERILDDSLASALADQVKRRLYNQTLSPPSAIETAEFSRHAFERTSHRLRFAFGIFVEPTEAEYMALKLPAALDWFYYLFRPARLAVKYARGWFGAE